MSNKVRVARNISEATEVLFNGVDELRAENQQLYRLILELVSDLNELENALSTARATSLPVKAQ
jgi:prefoldin subunit 5